MYDNKLSFFAIIAQIKRAKSNREETKQKNYKKDWNK